jgi:carbon-monoxide dehydrogenase large subunit
MLETSLVTGRGLFVADIDRPRQVWMRVVRSPVAHGRLLGVDLDGARAHEGVTAAFSGADLPEQLKIPIRLSAPERGAACLQPALARTHVNYVGEPLAVVVATDPYVAEDAAAEVWADIEELDPLLEPLEARRAAPLHAGLDSNLVGTRVTRFGDDVESALASADVVIRRTISTHRHSAIPMETRGLVAELGADGRLTIWGMTKVKHFNRRALAGMLGLEESGIRLLETEVGGSFGVRGELYPEDLLVPWLALFLQRPVKWVEDRAEHFVATNHSREHVFDVTVGAMHDGKLVALRSESFSSIGAYVRTTGIKVTELSVAHLAGPYPWKAIEVTGHAVLTNKTPMGTYRGPGEVEPTFARERMLDELAAELGLDPAAVREINLTRDRFEASPNLLELPLLDVKGQRRAPERFRAVLERAGYEPRASRSDGPYLEGTGIACYQDEGGYGPHEEVRVVAEPDGSFTVYSGVASSGQGVRVSLARIMADALEIDPDRISVNHHDTDVIPEGFGAFASRTTVVAGNAAALAAADLRAAAARRGAEKLGVTEEGVVLEGDRVTLRSGDGPSVTMGDLGIEGRGRFERDGIDVSFGVGVATVRIDRATGRVAAVRYVLGCDVGRAVTPAVVQGQLVGAAAQGIGGVLLEELPYDSTGQPLATSFMDYLMPTVSELPEFDAFTFEDGAGNALGVKGCGEAGIIGAAAAFANAVANALGKGAQVNALPLSPERVRSLIT